MSVKQIMPHAANELRRSLGGHRGHHDGATWPEQGYRSCLGLLRLTKQYGPERVEAASARAVALGARSYRHVDAILKHGLDRVPLEGEDAPPAPRPAHANVRGPAYRQQELPHAD